MVLEDWGMFFSEPCGKPIPGTDPWPEQNESDGGVHIPCHYIINLCNHWKAYFLNYNTLYPK